MAYIDIVKALDKISEATKDYIDSTNFSGYYTDLKDIPDNATKEDVQEVTTQATDDDVANMLEDIFKIK